MIINRLKKLPLYILTAAMFFTVFLNSTAAALSTLDSAALNGNWTNYVPDDGSAAACSTTLTGSDNEEKTFNYFVGKGLSPAQAAGIMGDLEQESHFDPEILQKGGDSKDPNDAGTDINNDGWGTAQWAPGGKIIAIAKGLNITGPIYELGTQLDIIFGEMGGTTPVGRQNILKDIKQMSDPGQVALYFNENFEGGTDPGGVRESDAKAILQKYGGSGGGSGSSASSGCSSSPDCKGSAATGNAKILCEAEAYNGIYYRWGGGHGSYGAFIHACPDPSNPPDNHAHGSPPDPTDGGLSGNPSPCATDCAGLVDIAVQAAFGTDLGGATVGGLEADSKNWKSLGSVADVQPGDIVVVGSDHVEIVDHYDAAGKVMHTFGSHQTGEKTSEVTSSPSNWTGAYRYIGPPGNGN